MNKITKDINKKNQELVSYKVENQKNVELYNKYREKLSKKIIINLKEVFIFKSIHKHNENILMSFKSRKGGYFLNITIEALVCEDKKINMTVLQKNKLNTTRYEMGEFYKLNADNEKEVLNKIEGIKNSIRLKEVFKISQ